MKKFLSTIGIVASLLPSAGFAATMDEAVVAQILGTRMPPSEVRVGTANNPIFNSVHFWDNISNVTPRVLDRSMRLEIVRVHTNMQNGERYINAAKKNKAALETHCQSRLKADGVANAIKECAM